MKSEDILNMKSEDILFEIKKIQQEDALERGYVYDLVKQKKMDRESAKKSFESYGNCQWSRKEILQFAQEKYSNGETAMQLFMDAFVPDGEF